MLSVPLTLPTLKQQDAILGELDELIGRSDAALRNIEASINLLTEYKHSLITAAVTGELDVTTAGSGIPG